MSMDALWFAIICSMLTVYVILDGFDFGVGILHRFVARTDQERRTVLAAIAPVWDGNEVWLIAAGALMFLSFPKTYAAALSGFYLALMMVLWLLILRGVAIEFRLHENNPLWGEFWDTIFALASSLLAVVLGTTLGNVIRGVPMDVTGYFAIPLFTDFRTGGRPGIFDWYTLLVGIFAFCVLAGHGAFYLAWKTEGAVRERSRAWARKMWLAVVPLWGASTFATAWIQPEIYKSLFVRPWSLGFVALMLGGIGGSFRFLRHEREWAAFLSSSLFLLGLLGATMTANYPFWLRSTLDPAQSLTAANTAADSYGLRTALIWWIIGIVPVVAYFAYGYRFLRGKVGRSTEEHGS
jgi:cytochrome d ubiquinol oxidase subunit II